ncbi:MAG: aminodeoxychorismate/anthranilate synthase component II [Lachnospiraceae bacterium]|nr:aminodeoxychorismate/anthranilate synthase component II [Lachnospiraceae bacterium]
MILLIDNYDSFSYNLYQLIGSIRPDIEIIRNDDLTVAEVIEKKPEAIILSPGPGRPKDAGICESLIKEVDGTIPILGVCLGHQAICESYGATIGYAKELMHGKKKKIKKTMESKMFREIGEVFFAARYHSLVAKRENLPDCLQVTALSEDGEIMAVEHKEKPVYGLQFHPESVMTEDGKQMIKNFLGMEG